MTTATIVRRPRLRVSINGTTVSGCISAEIRSARGSNAASFRIELSADAFAASSEAGWIDGDALAVSIDMGFTEATTSQPQSWTSMITGPVDRVTSEPLAGLIVMDGRDNAARLIDLPLQDGYLNRTASEVVADLAMRCGLTSDADQTDGLIGQYYQIQHSKTVFGAYSRHANGWDLLCELAQIQNFELWVDGTTLHFKQPTGQVTPFLIALQQDRPEQPSSCSTMSTIALDRAMGISGPIQVKVASWNSRQKQTITQTYPVDADDDARLYTVLKPNLLSDDALRLARSTYLQIRARQRSLSGSMPGELSLSPRSVLQLSGTGTAWDTLYVVDHISRYISADHGFTQTITAVSVQDGT